jgi:HAD superfamily hydrolase (TIGR01509 family)
MRWKGAIFDLDGTLVDSMPVWNDFGKYYLNMRGIEAPAGLHDVLKPMSLLQAAQYFREQFGLGDTQEEILAQFNVMLKRQYRDNVPLKPHVLPMLNRLREAGIKLCIATATDRNLAESALVRLGVAGFFDFVLTCTDVGCGKDDSLIFCKALAMLGTKKDETIVFEDALHAIRTAKEAGFAVVGVYDESAAADADEIKKIADCTIKSFDEWEIG